MRHDHDHELLDLRLDPRLRLLAARLGLRAAHGLAVAGVALLEPGAAVEGLGEGVRLRLRAGGIPVWLAMRRGPPGTTVTYRYASESDW